MDIHSVEFIGAIGQIGQAQPDGAAGLPQIAFSGRSNVGKSSLINCFLGRTRTPVARVSQTPGKTQEINFFRVRSESAEFVLVDLPGYGYARAPFELREKWAEIIRGFLTGSSALRGIVQLIDIRHGPTADDLRAIDLLGELGLPALIVLTKADKLKLERRKLSTKKIVGELSLDSAQVIVSSAMTGDGMEELREAVGGLLLDSDPATDTDAV